MVGLDHTDKARRLYLVIACSHDRLTVEALKDHPFPR